VNGVGRLESQGGFLTVVLWLCVAGAMWLLLAPAAFQRRALTRRVVRAEVSTESQRLHTSGLQRWHDGLENDPSVLEREARKLGYGFADERSYPVSAEVDLADADEVWRKNALAAQARLAAKSDSGSWRTTIRYTVAPVLMLIIVGAIAFLFFRGLHVEDPYPNQDGFHSTHQE